MKRYLYLFTLIALLTSCGTASTSASESISDISPSTIPQSSVTEESSIEISPTEESSSENIPESSSLAPLDSNLYGLWYITSTASGTFSINDTLEVLSDDSVEFTSDSFKEGAMTFYYEGQYEDYEGSFKFVTESGISTLVLQMSDDVLAWGFEDTASNSDFGYADRDKFEPGIKYQYEGEDWPMEEINTFLGTTGSIDAYEADYYYMHEGTSDLYECNYCMIEIHDVASGQDQAYASQLNTAGFSIAYDGSTFYRGCDDNHNYYLRIHEYEDDKELDIFIYKYSDIVKEA